MKKAEYLAAATAGGGQGSGGGYQRERENVGVIEGIRYERRGEENLGGGRDMQLYCEGDSFRDIHRFHVNIHAHARRSRVLSVSLSFTFVLLLPSSSLSPSSTPPPSFSEGGGAQRPLPRRDGPPRAQALLHILTGNTHKNTIKTCTPHTMSHTRTRKN